MAIITKIRTRTTGDQTKIMVLIRHPMQPGPLDDDPTPGQFIEQMTFALNGRTVAVAELGSNVTENPLTAGILVTDAKVGDKVAVSWTDNVGGSGGAETEVR